MVQVGLLIYRLVYIYKGSTMRPTLFIIAVSFLLNCSNETELSARDCRQARFACSPNFQCITNSSGVYECLPSSESNGDMYSPVPDVGSERTNTDINNEEDSASSQSDVALEPLDLGVPGEMPQTDANPSESLVQQGDIVLSNASERCDRIGLVGPVLPQEAGHRVAAVLDPIAYPFAVTSVEYELITATDTPNCTGALEHDVELMVLTTEGELPNNPSVDAQEYRSYDIPADYDSAAGRLVVLTLPAPLIIEQNELLVVSVQLSAYQQQHLCISRCLDNDAPPQTDWWSNAAEAPYDWKDLIVDYQFKGVLRIRAVGHQINQR